jgi:XTP/dITP diphosphohydrolase
MSGPLSKLLIATHNQGKFVEMAQILSRLEVDLVGLSDVGIDWDVEETGETIPANAILKAESYARASGMLALADDSGLEVDALDGAPGVRSARFGDEGLDPEGRYRLLLEKLEGVPWERRTARFRCVVAVAGPDGLLATEQGTVEGHVTLEPSGTGGFGYDPVFFVSGEGTTMAQLPAQVKNRISHRGRALAAILPRLKALLEA